MSGFISNSEFYKEQIIEEFQSNRISSLRLAM